MDLDKILEIDRSTEWYGIVTREKPLLFQAISYTAQGQKEIMKKNLGVDFYFTKRKNIINESKAGIEDTIKFRQIIREKGIQFVSELIEEGIKNCDECIDFARKINSIDTIEESKVTDFFEKYLDNFYNVAAFLGITNILDHYLHELIETKLVKILKREGKKKELPDYIGIISIQPRLNYFQQEPIEILKITCKIQEDKRLVEILQKDIGQIKEEIKKESEIISNLKNHAKDFGWLNKNYWMGTPFEWHDYLPQIKTLLEKNCNEELEKITKDDEEKRKRFEETVKELNFSDELLEEIKILQKMIFFHTRRIETFFISEHLCQNLIRAVIEKLAIPKEELYYAAPKEILDALYGREIPNRVKLQERQKGYAIYSLDQELYVFSGRDLERVLKIQKEIKLEERILKGTSVYSGIVKGGVRIIKSKTDLKNIKQGEIVVTPMTDVDYTPYLGKVSAIVTDEGGITSHAAIISRELGIPCVIGTKIATKMFRDGDKIEVNAEEGVVKRL